MDEVKLKQVVAKDGELLITGLPFKKGQPVKIVVSPQQGYIHTPLTVKQLRESGLIGLWQDRADVDDSSAFARQLREQTQRKDIHL